MTRSGSSDDPPSTSDDPHGTVPLRQLRRTRVQRLAITAAMLTTILCFIGAGALVFGQQTVERRQTVSIDNRSDREAGSDGNDGAVDRGDEDHAEEAATASTFPEADPEAKNFLITGADNGECIDPESPFAGGFGDRDDMGARSDTIMIWRIDPTTSRAAVLSLPRDLWVTRASTGGEGKINSEYRRNDPQDLIYTINDNFGIYIDHFVQVDFCAFKELVNAVGGVTVPFEYPTRDENTGLFVPEPGCYTFDGDHALAYVRSRKDYEILSPGEDLDDENANWEQDGTSDRGRITRQQDFMRRLLNEIVDRGMLNPSVVRSLYRTLTDYVVMDENLTLQRIMEFAGVAEDIDPQGIPTYQFVAEDAIIGGQSALIPEPDAEGMPEVLALFRGERSLEQLPDTVPDQPRDGSAPAGTSTTTTTTPAPGTTDGSTAPPEASVPQSTTRTTVARDDSPEDIQYGMYPDPNATCD